MKEPKWKKVLNFVVSSIFFLLFFWTIGKIESLPEKWINWIGSEGIVWIGFTIGAIAVFNALHSFYHFSKHTSRINSENHWIKTQENYAQFIAEDESRIYLYKEDMAEEYQQWINQ